MPVTSRSSRSPEAAGPARSAATTVLVVLGAALVVLGIVAGYVNRTVLDANTFADHADQLRRDPAVSQALGHALTDAYLDQMPDAVAVRPLLDTVATTVVGSGALSGPTRAAARSFQRSLTVPNSDDAVLRLADTGAVLSSLLAQLAPDRAPVSTSTVSVQLARIGGQAYAVRTFRLARDIRLATWLLPLLGIFMIGAGVLAARDRRRRWLITGWSLIGAVVLVGLALFAGSRWAASFRDDSMTDVLVRRGWHVFVTPIGWHLAGTALIGVLIVISAAALVPTADPVAGLAVAWRRATQRPAQPALATLRALTMTAAGIVIVLQPRRIAVLVTVLAGVWIIALGVRELGLATARRPGAGSAPPVPATRSRSRAVWSTVSPALIVLAVLIGWGARPTRSAPAASLAAQARGCDGDVALCGRAFNDVAFAASHNSMSVATDRSWYIPEQGRSLTGQLDLGVRALLIDVWPGYPTRSGTVATARSAYAEAKAVAEKDMGPDVVAAGLRVAGAISDDRAAGSERLYMCHGLCEIGATDLVDAMTRVRGWLADHPREVLTIIIENHADNQQIGAALDRAGIGALAFTPPVSGGRWPTLGHLIDSGQRVLVMLEQGDGGTRYPWLVDGYAHLLQETPYTFSDAAAFSCAPNRGPAAAPLFLVNHWLSGFRRLVSNAQAVNTESVLGRRVRDCRQQRQPPNFVAVNYADIGDTVEVARQLNGLDGG